MLTLRDVQHSVFGFFERKVLFIDIALTLDNYADWHFLRMISAKLSKLHCIHPRVNRLLSSHVEYVRKKAYPESLLRFA